MTAAEVLSRAYAAGAVVSRHGRRLRYRIPPGPLADPLVALLREHKEGLLELLPNSAFPTPAVCTHRVPSWNPEIAAQDAEVQWRFARMARRVPTEGPLPPLVARFGLLRTPGRCPSCGELLGLAILSGRYCAPCASATELIRLVYAAGLLIGGRIVLPREEPSEPAREERFA